jgi:hypothetical protein
MPEFMLTGPDGKSYKLTAPDGVTHEDAERELLKVMTFGDRIESYGEPATEKVEDRRNDPKDPYVSMLKGNQFVRQVYRQTFPFLKDLDIELPEPKYKKLESGQLPEQAGIHDIGTGKANSDQSHIRSDWQYPFASAPTDDELAQTSTHQAERPNPAEPYLKGVRDFATGGVSDVLRGAGVQMPQASNAIGDVLKSDAANTAMGMVNPIKYGTQAINASLDWLARSKFGASDVNIHPRDLVAARKDIQDYFRYDDPADYVHLAMRQGMQDPNVRRVSTAPKQYVGMPAPFRPNQFKAPGAPANANTSSFSPSRTRASVEEELRDANANIQGYKDAIARMPARADSSHLYDALTFEHQVAERLGKELSGQSEAGKILGFHPAPASAPPMERLPQPLERQRLDRPINQQTLNEMRGLQPESPPLDPRPINPETLSEMRANDPLGNGPLSPLDPLSK